MVREIVKDVFFLTLPSSEAGAEDLETADDLKDTLAGSEGCAGMAANMIGVRKRIIAFFEGDEIREMFNPEIISRRDPYDTEEGCLSLSGTRKCRRYRTIKVRWQDRQFRTRIKNFTGFTAEVIQHEIDHCEGRVI